MKKVFEIIATELKAQNSGEEAAKKKKNVIIRGEL